MVSGDAAVGAVAGAGAGAGGVPPRPVGDWPVSAIGLGGAPIALAAQIPGQRSAVRMVQAALDAGVTLLDTADVYSRACEASPRALGTNVIGGDPRRNPMSLSAYGLHCEHRSEPLRGGGHRPAFSWK